MTAPKYKMQVTGRGRALLFAFSEDRCGCHVKLLARISRWNRGQWVAKCDRTGKLHQGRTRFDAIEAFKRDHANWLAGWCDGEQDRRLHREKA